MSDPLDERFRDFATGTPAMNPASPTEIRRRGDRMRRRRTALTAAGAALAIVLIATPVAVLATGGDEDVQPAPPSPTVTDPPSEDPEQPTETAPPEEPVVSEIPPEFPLAAGYPPENGNDGTPVEVTDEPGVPTILACEAPVWAADDVDAVDVAGAGYIGEAEDFRGRTLVLYGSVERAEANVTEQIVAGIEACPKDGQGGGGSEWTVQGTEGDTTIITKQYVSGGQPVPGLEVYLVTRVANALLVDWNYGEGGATDSSRDAVIEFALDQQADVVTAMQQFAGGTTDPPASEPSGSLPDYFLPTAAELPVRDRLTPWEEVETEDEQLVGCQPLGIDAEEVIQRSYTARIAPADGLPAGEDVAAEVRISVLQYGSAGAGEAAEAAVTGWIRDCDDPLGTALDDATRQGALVDTEAGVYGTWVYAAPETCTECGAAWFDRMGVLADQGRMVVVSYRELGGPLEPEGVDAFMRDVMLNAAGRSMPG